VTTTALPPDLQTLGPPTGATGAQHRPPKGLARLRGRSLGLLRGRAEDAAWVRPALLALLLGAALLYLWDLGSSGWGNSFYAAAAQAGSPSWKAWFFGSSDAANSITVDKPPASLWVMGLSGRLFGVNHWSVLAPQALEGVAAAGLLYATVRRHFSAAVGLIAGAVLALTPVAVLMFRFNNPDALLVLLLVAGAYALTRSLNAGSTRWLALAGALVGFAFLAKMLQALLVVPAFALVYLAAAPVGVGRRIWQLLVAGAAMVAAAGWWIAAVALTPASARPFIGGSQHNSILELTFGYNGFGRLTGNETGSVGGGGAAAAGGVGGAAGGRWGTPGAGRLFGPEMGTQIAWLLPAALLLLVAGLWLTRRAVRTDGQRAGLLLWGGWLVVTGVTLSYAKGIIHPYYTVALAPAIGALVGAGATLLWQQRGSLVARLLLAVALGGTGVWAYLLLDRTPTFQPWLRGAVAFIALMSAVLVVGLPWLGRRVGAVVGAATLVAALGAPAAYAADTATTPHTGAIPSAGPASGRGPGGFGGFGGFGAPGGPGSFGDRARLGGAGAAPFGPGGFGGVGRGGGTGATGGAGGRGGIGGLLDSRTPGAALTTALKGNAGRYTWVAAAVGSNIAAGVQLATGLPVMAIGGFNGSDPSPTLAQFQADVRAGKIHYFLGGVGFGGAGGGFGGQTGGSSASSEISAWVQSTFTATTVGGQTVYDLTSEGGTGRTGSTGGASG